MEIFLQFWINKHPPNECDYTLLLSARTLQERPRRFQPSTGAQRQKSQQKIQIRAKAVFHFTQMEPNVCSCRGMRSERGEKIWLIHKLWTKLGLLEVTHSGIGDERDGKVVGGPGIKEAKKGDWCWGMIIHGCLSSSFFVYLQDSSSCPSETWILSRLLLVCLRFRQPAREE